MVCDSRQTINPKAAVKNHSANLFVSDAFLFAEILMQRPLKLHKYQLKLSLSDEDMKYMTAMARERFDKITLALRQMPNNLLLVIRYSACNLFYSLVILIGLIFQEYQHDSSDCENARRSSGSVSIDGEKRYTRSFRRRKRRSCQKNERIQSILAVRVSAHHGCCQILALACDSPLPYFVPFVTGF